MTGQQLYETYLKACGWSSSTAPAWNALQLHRQKAWEMAAAAAREEQVMATGAIKVYSAMLAAVSLAP
jgi:hypothetical protein